MGVPITEDAFYFLTKKVWPLPKLKVMKNKNGYIASLGNVCKLLSEQAENLGANIFSGFIATRAIFNKKGVMENLRTVTNQDLIYTQNKLHFLKGAENH